MKMYDQKLSDEQLENQVAKDYAERDDKTLLILFLCIVVVTWSFFSDVAFYPMALYLLARCFYSIIEPVYNKERLASYARQLYIKAQVKKRYSDATDSLRYRITAVLFSRDEKAKRYDKYINAQSPYIIFFLGTVLFFIVEDVYRIQLIIYMFVFIVHTLIRGKHRPSFLEVASDGQDIQRDETLEYEEEDYYREVVSAAERMEGNGYVTKLFAVANFVVIAILVAHKAGYPLPQLW